MKGLILFSHGMEDNEALGTVSLLRRAKIDIFSASSSNDSIITTSYQQNVFPDFKLENINLNQFDFLVIPGGPYVRHIIDEDKVIQDVIKVFYEQKKLICAICAAPRFLGRLGILDGINFTAYPGSELDAPKGIYHKNQKAMIDQNIITARSAGSVVEFVYEIVKKIKGEDAAKSLISNIIY